VLTHEISFYRTSGSKVEFSPEQAKPLLLQPQVFRLNAASGD